MAKFEDLFEDLDVHTQVMDSAMSTATTLSTPEGQVDSLMKQVSVSVCTCMDAQKVCREKGGVSCIPLWYMNSA